MTVNFFMNFRNFLNLNDVDDGNIIWKGKRKLSLCPFPLTVDTIGQTTFPKAQKSAEPSLFIFLIVSFWIRDYEQTF